MSAVAPAVNAVPRRVPPVIRPAASTTFAQTYSTVREADRVPEVSDAVVIMAKYPEPGRVKTRLAANVGAAAACDLYRAFLADIEKRVCSGPWRTIWAVAPAGARFGDVLSGNSAILIDQRGAGLGSRMYHAFSDAFDSGAARVVMIGADTPQLSLADISQAFAALDDVDVAIVPSRDGGYCLIGMRRRRDIYSSVEMGTERVLEQTRVLCDAERLSFRLLAEQFDIDDIDDVRELLAAADTVSELSSTAATLDQWRRNGLL